MDWSKMGQNKHFQFMYQGYSSVCVGTPSIWSFHLSNDEKTQGPNERNDREELYIIKKLVLE
jgi:hypothetical protein